MNQKFCQTKKGIKIVKFGFGLFFAMIFFGVNNQGFALDANTKSQNQLLSLEIPKLSSLEYSPLYLSSAQELLNVKLIIRLSKRRVYVYKEDQEIASYPIAVGKKGWETPQGNFEIIKKIEHPSWQNPWTGKVIPPGANNPLGERWIAFWTDGKNFIGFHGTPGENLIGQAVSHGCVRMKNKDVIALFDLVAIGTPVIVQP